MGISRAGLFKRLAAIPLMLLICHYAGQTVPALGIAFAVAALEIATWAVLRHEPVDEEDASMAVALTMLALGIAFAVIYLLPAMLLASQPSVPLMLAGVIWMFGVYAHISNSFVALPVHNWSQMLPAIAMAGVVFACTPAVTFDSMAPAHEWAVPAILMLVYATHTYDTLNLQKDTHRALETTREEANVRLRALEHMTRHDGLTGLLTRRAFDEGLAKMLARRQAGRHVGVMLIDLDGFKPINDSYSHDAGDRVLTVIGERLARLAGTEGIAARLGGDEFVLAFPSLMPDAATTRLSRHVLREIERPILWQEKSLRVGASIGVALSGMAGSDVPELCSAADRAMYGAKSSGSGKAVLFDPADFPPRPGPDDRAAALAALESGEIGPLYQPLVRLSDGSTHGFEAQLYWHRPGHDLLGPDEVLPMLTELGLQGDLMLHMTARVLQDIDALLSEGLDPGRVSFDLSEAALATQSGRAELERALARLPHAAEHLTLEITDEVFGSRSGGLVEAGMLQLRRAEMRLSLDGIGGAAGSFIQLRKLDFDELKIAPSFVGGLGRDRNAEVLVAGLLSIARGLEVAAVACGVATDDQHAQLLRLGCPYGQGDRFGVAAPFEDVRDRLLGETVRPALAAAGR